jgi:hypothetical protein
VLSRLIYCTRRKRVFSRLIYCTSRRKRVFSRFIYCTSRRKRVFSKLAYCTIKLIFILLCYFIVGGPGVKKAVATKRHQETESAGPESKRLTTSHDNVKTPVR